MKSEKRGGFTLVELLVVIGVIALLISILLPSLQKAREAGYRVACASNLRQLGQAFQMYINDSKGTYPPSWFQDDFISSTYAAGSNGVGQQGHNATWVTLLRPYVGMKNSDPTKGGDLGIFKCPKDTYDRANWLPKQDQGILSYMMPESWSFDKFNYSNRFPPQPAGTTLNRGIGQLFTSGGYPMWVRTTMVHPVSQVILLTERSYSEQVQSPYWYWGYATFGKPTDQMWLSGSNNAGNAGNGYYGFPMLHASKGGEKFAYFNYLFCDGHVELLNPRQTIHDLNTVQTPPLATWMGGDFMWTIMPGKYKNN
jgi:prepilin-type N-terminal cleavage/methylation domain-containing protein/prepilin-type processing-associated H-X9-DG protein